TSTATRFSSPCLSSCARKSRRSLYFIYVLYVAGPGASISRSCQVIQRDTGKYRCAHPVVVEKSLEAARAVAVVDQAVLIQDQPQRCCKANVINDAEILHQANGSHTPEKNCVAQHHTGNVETSERDGGSLDADLEIVDLVHHGVFGIVGDHPHEVCPHQEPGKERHFPGLGGECHRDAKA